MFRKAFDMVTCFLETDSKAMGFDYDLGFGVYFQYSFVKDNGCMQHLRIGVFSLPNLV